MIRRPTRRAFLATLASAAVVLPRAVRGDPRMPGGEMYGLIGRMTATDGRRDELVSILLEAMQDLPGCLSYVVAKDPSSPNDLWITEVWASRESHAASLTLPAVREAIGRGRPLITGFGERTETQPVGGIGLGVREGS